MSWHESCGIFGVYAPEEDVARLTFFALFALQHRGQESSGIATTNGRNIRLHTGMGLVSHVFNEDSLGRLPGTAAIGHNRYSTMGSSRPTNAQPIVVEGADEKIALAHNGNIVNHSRGCLIIGKRRGTLAGKPAVFNSRTALRSFVDLMEHESFMLNIIGNQYV